MADHSILLGCFEPPAFGGASTSGYQLFRELSSTFSADYLNFVPRRDVAKLEKRLGSDLFNPENLHGVSRFILDNPTYQHQPGLTERVSELAPSLLVGIGYIAAFVLKQARPDLPMILLTTGCQQVKDALGTGELDTVQQLLSGEHEIRIVNDIEQRAVEISDVVVTHSELIHRLYELYFPRHNSKILKRVHWFYDWIYCAASRSRDDMREFEFRDIDILFIASDWGRVEKNYPLVKSLSTVFRQRAIHVVGQTDETIPGAVHHGLVPNRVVMGLLGRSKVLVCPSRFDAAPGILFEGAALGCNLVASVNCGNHHICHPSLLAESLDAESFARCIDRALKAPFQANRSYFASGNCMQHLCELFDRYLGVTTATASAGM